MTGVGLGAGTGKDGECWMGDRWEGWAEEMTTKEGERARQDEGMETGWMEWHLGGGNGAGKDGEEGSEG